MSAWLVTPRWLSGGPARAVAALAITGIIAARALFARLPPATSLDQRLAMFPTRDLPLRGRVRIHWDAHQVPYIEAERDDDLAFVLGLVHAHLRLGQMVAMRLIAEGRLSEVVGPVTTGIDHALRLLDLGRATPEILAAMRPADRRWLARFVEGVNTYAGASVGARARMPYEIASLGIRYRPFTEGDVITMGRLGSVDVNWFVWFSLLGLRARPDWPDIWRMLVREGSDSTPSYAPNIPADLERLNRILAGGGKAGSNSVVVSGRKSASGGALIASDPHLGFTIPNIWLIAGYKSPSYNVVGLMIPGIPFVALGRNRDIAWGGTNLRAAASDLIDVSGLAAADFTTRKARIGVRSWFDKRVRLRETRFGPVITDAPMIDSATPAALVWTGHRASNELGAMLAVNRARTFEEFRTALAGFGLSPQNMLYADRRGNIGEVMATHLPARPPGPPDDLLQPPAAMAAWRTIVTARELPAAYNPPAGVIASANNRAAPAAVAIGYFFSPNDRVERLRSALEGAERVDVAMLAALQRDTYMASSVAFRDALTGKAGALFPDGEGLDAAQRDALALLRGWDGRYDADSAGALAFEQTLARFIEAYFSAPQRKALQAGGRGLSLMTKRLADAPPDATLRAALLVALAGAAEGIARFGVWGEAHRMRLAHPLASLPAVGRRYRFAEFAVGGSSQTLMKTAHATTTERHTTRFGSQARHISDMADPNANYFLLLGGEDGWFNSATFLDQAAMWRRGAFIRLPLEADAAAAQAAHTMVLEGR